MIKYFHLPRMFDYDGSKYKNPMDIDLTEPQRNIIINTRELDPVTSQLGDNILQYVFEFVEPALVYLSAMRTCTHWFQALRYYSRIITV